VILITSTIITSIVLIVIALIIMWCLNKFLINNNKHGVAMDRFVYTLIVLAIITPLVIYSAHQNIFITILATIIGIVLIVKNMYQVYKRNLKIKHSDKIDIGLLLIIILLHVSILY